MLKAINLTKAFDDFQAVKGVSFEVKKGEVVGFLGPNGAGKSTTMKMITGFLGITEGSVDVCGHPVGQNTKEAQKRIGYVPENAPLYEELYVREFLEFMGRMRCLDESRLKQRVDDVIQTCNLEEVEFQTIETLSKGYKRRVSLAQALIHDPEILILDEPTDGLDPNQKHDVRNLIKELSQTKGILISTHILEEVEEVCDRCLIVGKGQILFSGTPEELKNKSQKSKIQDVFRALTTGESVEGVAL